MLADSRGRNLDDYSICILRSTESKAQSPKTQSFSNASRVENLAADLLHRDDDLAGPGSVHACFETPRVYPLGLQFYRHVAQLVTHRFADPVLTHEHRRVDRIHRFASRARQLVALCCRCEFRGDRAEVHVFPVL